MSLANFKPFPSIKSSCWSSPSNARSSNLRSATSKLNASVSILSFSTCWAIFSLSFSNSSRKISRRDWLSTDWGECRELTKFLQEFDLLLIGPCQLSKNNHSNFEQKRSTNVKGVSMIFFRSADRPNDSAFLIELWELSTFLRKNELVKYEVSKGVHVNLTVRKDLWHSQEAREASLPVQQLLLIQVDYFNVVRIWILNSNWTDWD